MAYFNPERPSYREDPYPALARLRAEEPVHWSEPLRAWLLTTYHDCDAALHDFETFGSGALGGAPVPGHERSPLRSVPPLVGSDPPEHTRLRRIVARAFAPATVERIRPSIDRAVERLLDGVAPGEPFDLVERVARPLPERVIAEHLGIADAEREQVLGWAQAMLAAMDPRSGEAVLDAAWLAYESLREYLARYVGEGPRETALARVAAAEGEGVTPEELLSLATDLLLVGNDVTTYAICNGALALWSLPDQVQALRAQPETLPQAIEEMLRYDSPSQAVPRVARRDVVLRGRRIREGDTVYMMTGAANRDPAEYREPDRFDPTRPNKRHLAFAAGPHYCLGAPLARLEMEAVFGALLERYREVRVVEGGMERRGNFVLRGFARLTLELT